MKTFFATLACGAALFATGCASHGPVLGTVGPQAASSFSQPATNGTLVVYSAYETGADFNSRNESGQSHSDYTILKGDGTWLGRIHNDAGTMAQDPTAVRLPPGKYTVIARANGYGSVTVPIMIEARQSTILHLEGGGAWGDESAFNNNNAVRLPDGRIVGWKAGWQ